MGEMQKTSRKLCKTCKYNMFFAGDVACDYACKTKQMRKCPHGMCDKYEKQTKVNKSIAFRVKND